MTVNLFRDKFWEASNIAGRLAFVIMLIGFEFIACCYA